MIEHPSSPSGHRAASQPAIDRASSPRVATEQPDHAAIEQLSSSPCATTEQSHNSHRAAIERPAIEQAAIKQPTSSHRASSHQAANKQPSRKQPSSYEQLSSSPCAATERPPNSHRTATEQPSSKQPSSKQLSRSQQAAIEQAATEWPPRSRIKQPSSSYRAAATGRPPNSHRTATEQLSSEEEQPLSRPCAATEQPLCGHRATTKQRPARSRRSRRSPGLRASEGRAQRAVRARAVGVRTVQNCGHWRTWMRRGCRRPEGLRVASATLGPKTDARHGRIWSGEAAGGRCAGGVRWTVCGRCAVPSPARAGGGEMSRAER